MEQLAYCYLPRPEMGDGPWADEPDHVQFEHAGVPCLAVRHLEFGSWCGYAAVPPGHPLHGLDWQKDDEGILCRAPAHWGVNYSGPCNGIVCHVTEPGDPDPVWWFGMDFHHGGDKSPAMDFRLREVNVLIEGLCPGFRPLSRYRDLQYVQAKLRALAEWLADAARRRTQ